MAAAADAAGGAAARRSVTDVPRPTASAPRSSATGTCGCATWRRKETQLTTDGVKDFGYATDNAGWTKSDRPIVLWSPDSKKIATFQQDGRKVGEMYLVEHAASGIPKLQAWKYPLPGDEHDLHDPARGHRRRRAARSSRLQMPPDQHRSTLCDHIVCRGGEWADVQWSPTRRSSRSSRPRATTSTSSCASPTRRPATSRRARGDVATFFESGNGRVNWRVPAGVERGDLVLGARQLGPLYLYDLTTGKLKNRITTRRRQRHAAAARRREDPRRSTSRRSAARRGATRTSRISTGSASTARTWRC